MSTSPASRISTEAARHRIRLGSRRFRSGLIGTIVALAVACAGLGAASVLQGPRIQGAQLDVAAAVAAPGTLRIVMDEAVAKIDDGDITVTPAVPITVSTEDDVVIVQFGAALAYDTDYAVELAGVRAAGGGVEATVRHEFTTPAFTATWLERAASGDRIMQASPGGEPQTLFTGAGIQDYLLLPDALFVVSLDEQGASHAAIVAADGVNQEDLTLPGEGRIELLEYVGTTVLYTFTSLEAAPSAGGTSDLPAFDDTLIRLDLSGTHISEPVTGLDGNPLAVDTIRPVPGTTGVLLHTRAGDVLRYDVDAGEPPTLVANYTEMGALAADRHRLAVKDTFGQLIYDLDDGSEERIEPSPLADNPAEPFIADVVPLSGGRWIERVALPSADFTSFDVFVAIDDGTTAALLFRTADDGGSILDYRITANEEYLIAEVSPTGDSPQNSDGYAAGARPRDVTTVVIDIASGDLVTEWTGSHARW